MIFQITSNTNTLLLTGTIQAPSSLNGRLEPTIEKWILVYLNPSLYVVFFSIILDDKWNMDRICLCLLTAKHKKAQEEKFYVTGDINEIGISNYIQGIGNKKNQ